MADYVDVAGARIYCGDGRDAAGRFVSGHGFGKATRFQLGYHWRQRSDLYDKDWLSCQYETEQKSASEIAMLVRCTENNVLYWLKKHGITTRTISQVRSIKYWGLPGERNGMFGVTGPASPTYISGSTPERQKMFSRNVGKAFRAKVLARDGYTCRRCLSKPTGPRSLHVHHLCLCGERRDLWFVVDNGVTLCRQCHLWVHSNRNTDGDWLRGSEYVEMSRKRLERSTAQLVMEFE